jgi:hypothetical protein
LSVIDQRVSALEDTSTSIVSTQGSSATASDHERRIAALEAQIYALQLQAAQAPASRGPQIDYPHQSLSSPHQASFGTNPSYGLTSPANGHSLPPFQQNANISTHSRYNPNSNLKHEVDSQGGGSYATDSGLGDYPQQPATKRWKGDEVGSLSGHRPEESFSDRPDFIQRGVVSEEEAAMCFDS